MPTDVHTSQPQEKAEKAAAGLIAKALGAFVVPNGVPQAPIAHERQLPKDSLTLKEAYEKGMRDREQWVTAKDKASITQTYSKVAAKWGEDRQLHTIEHEEVLKWRDDMRKEPGKRTGTLLTHSTINHRLSMLSVLLELARVRPHGVKHLPTRGNRRERRAREEEIQALISWCHANYERKGALTLADMITVGLNTTARAGELGRLQWPDVYFDLRQLCFRDTKNGKSRMVPMADVVYDILHRRRENGLEGPFSDLGKPQRLALFKAARQALKLDEDHEFVFHVVTRHEGASRLGDQGASAFQLKAMMGNTIQAADIYCKPSVESLRGLANGITRNPTSEQ
jgi:integrase